MNRRLLAAAAAAAVAVLAPAGPVAADEAAAITELGWWSRRPGATELPAGSFEVALLPSGPASQAALRIEVKVAPVTSALLELEESSQVLADVALIQACPTDEPWTPANPGPWGEAPTPDCEGASVRLGRNADGTWTADVGPLLRGGSSSLVVLPAAELSDQQQSVSFQVVFSGARLVAAPAGAAATSDPTAADAPTPVPFVAAPAPAPAPRPGPVTAPASVAPEPTAAAASSASTDFAAPAGGADAGGGRPWWRLLIGIPLSIGAGVAAAAGRRYLQPRA